MGGVPLARLAERPVSGPLPPHVIYDCFKVGYALVLLADGLLHRPLVLHELFLVLFLQSLSFLVKLGPKIFVLFLRTLQQFQKILRFLRESHFVG
jgi:hypothetical protein